MSKLILNVTLRRHFFVSVSSSSPRAIQLIRITFPNRPTSDHRFCTTRVLSSLSNHSQRKMEAEHYQFGPYEINPKEVFFSSKLSYALVNLRPLVPGFWLKCGITFAKLALREVKRFIDLTADETSDLWSAAQKIGRQLESYHNASSLTFAIQDGPQAGQTVPHVHVHIIPRKSGDFEKNDEIYDALDEKEKELKQSLDLDKERKDRSMEEMAQEADEYRKLFL
nr:bifunctional bis(5'-adenosyl)-triphosphatase/adenylylsulfatase FHIT [Ipomoea batatas]